MKKVNRKKIGDIGLFLNFVGSVFLAVSLGTHPGGSIGRFPLAITDPIGGHFGLFIFVAGYILQIIERELAEKEKVSTLRVICFVLIFTIPTYVFLAFIMPILIFR